MQYRTLGGTGLNVSTLCLGTMTFGDPADERTSGEIVQRALDAGINFFDTASIYAGGESERILGKALQGRREQVVIASKVPGPPTGRGPAGDGLSPDNIVRQAEASLSRLGSDYIDIYYAHWPDPRVPLEETLAAFDRLVRQGKVRHVALSNYPAWQVCRALRIADKRGLATVAAVQPRYSLLDRGGEGELFPLCLEEGLGVAAYSPLAGGFLTGKYSGPKPPPGSRAARHPAFARRLLTEANLRVAAAARAVAQGQGASLSHLALAWVLANPAVTAAIVGATSPAQLQETIPAADLTLPPVVVERLNDISAGGDVRSP